MKLNEEGKRTTAREARIPAFVELGNETGFPHEGYIDFVDNRLDPEHRHAARARGASRPGIRCSRPGSLSRVRIAGATPYRAALIDDKVISSQQGVKYAFVVKPDNTHRAPQPRDGHDLRGQTHREERAEGRREGRLHAAAIGAAGHAGAAGAGEKPAPLAAAASANREARSAAQRTRHELRPLLHRPADLRRRDQHRHHARRRHRAVDAADRAVSRDRAADDPGHGELSRREREGRRGNRGHADRAAGQRRREHALHVVAEHERRQHGAQRHLQARHQSRYRAGARAKPRGHRHSRRCRPRCSASASRRRSSRPTSRWSCTSSRPTARSTRSSPAITRCSRSATNSRGSMAWATSTSSARASIRCASGSIPNKVAARELTAQDVVAGDPGAERAGRRGHRRRAAGAERRDRISIHGQHAGPARG